jgi:hypothetical protein
MTNETQKTAVDSIIEFCQKQMDNDSSIHKGVYLSIIKFCKKQITEESEIHWKTTLLMMTNNKQQTAVKWYDNEIEKLFNQFIIDKINIYEFRTKRFKLLEQAKEMEKELMKGVYVEGSFAKMRYYDGLEYIDADQYYNETYGAGNK